MKLFICCLLILMLQNPKEVMFAEYSDGEQKYELKQSDIDLLRRAGYKVSLEARRPACPRTHLNPNSSFPGNTWCRCNLKTQSKTLSFNRKRTH
jgi:hypothetical protein